MTALAGTSKRELLISKRGLTLLALAAAIISWIGLWFFYNHLGIEYPTSDPKTYWDGSTRLVNSFFEQPEVLFQSHHRDHVPGYPALIALARGIFGWNDPELMRVMTLIGWFANLFVIYKILILCNIPFPLRGWRTLLYGMFPLVGMSLAVHPISDTFALLFLTTGILFFLLRRYAFMAVFLALALLMHKFTWPGVFIVLALGLWQKRIGLPIATLVVGPMAAYWIAISLHYSDPFYLIGGNINVGLENQRQYPLLDGVLQTLLDGVKGSFPDLIKGSLVGIILFICLWLLIEKVWVGEKALLAFLIPLLFFGLLTAPYLVFAVVRFGKLLVIPVLVYINQRPRLNKHSTMMMPVLVILSLLSQFAFTYYQTGFYD